VQEEVVESGEGEDGDGLSKSVDEAAATAAPTEDDLKHPSSPSSVPPTLAPPIQPPERKKSLYKRMRNLVGGFGPQPLPPPLAVSAETESDVLGEPQPSVKELIEIQGEDQRPQQEKEKQQQQRPTPPKAKTPTPKSPRPEKQAAKLTKQRKDKSRQVEEEKRCRLLGVEDGKAAPATDDGPKDKIAAQTPPCSSPSTSPSWFLSLPTRRSSSRARKGVSGVADTAGAGLGGEKRRGRTVSAQSSPG
jgi:hypothetical protein